MNDPVNYCDPFGLSASDSVVVKPGDTYGDLTWAFNQKNGTHLTAKEVADFNGDANPNLIHPGDVIYFPGKSTTTTITTATTATQVVATPSGSVSTGNMSNLSGYSAPFNYGTGKYGSLPTFGGINSGNAAVDIIVNGGIVGTYNLVAGFINTLDNGIGEWKELIAYGIEHVIDFLDENIPCEYTMTGGGFRQDLYAIEQVGFVNPTLIPDALACLSESVKYAKVMGGASKAASRSIKITSNGSIRLEKGVESVNRSIQKKLGVKISGSIQKPWHLVINGKEIPLNPLNPNWEYFRK